MKRLLAGLLGLFSGGGLTGFAACLLLGMSIGGASAWKVQNWRHDAEKTAQLQEERRINAKRASVSDEIGTKSQTAQVQIRTVTKTLIREVPTYVSANDCPMSPGFRVFHDASARGVLPDPANLANATAVAADVVANTVAENYGTCIENAERLRGLQEWVRAQKAVK